VTVVVLDDSSRSPIESAIVGFGRSGSITGADGVARVEMPRGTYVIRVRHPQYVADSATVSVAGDSSVTFALARRAERLETVIVSATRAERRVEDTPLRVEIVDEEEIAEKAAMTPGDIAMLLNESSGLRVQTVNPATGAASLRIQGLRGRYSLILADGLPLYGSTGSTGIVQIPPLDLARVEIIKGTSSALYGGAALGGVVNLVSRRPGDERDDAALLNATSRGGADAVLFSSSPLTGRTGFTVLAGVHRQSLHDADRDGWADLPEYERYVVRPRLFFDDGSGRTALFTIGAMTETRRGGAAPGLIPPAGELRPGLESTRLDGGFVARWLLPSANEGEPQSFLSGSIMSLRGSAQRLVHEHSFSDFIERDRHLEGFVEGALAVPAERHTLVIGTALQHVRHVARDVTGFDESRSVPALFGQLDVDIARWATISGSGRMDWYEGSRPYSSPRLSLLLRSPEASRLAGWTLRLSAGGGVAPPSPFIDETAAVGLTMVVPPPHAASMPQLSAERASTASIDMGGPLATRYGDAEVGASFFRSRVRGGIQARPAGVAGAHGQMLELFNSTIPMDVRGVDAFARIRLDDVAGGDLGIFAGLVALHSTEEDPESGLRHASPLVPRLSASLDVVWEREGEGRLGLELFHTGRQALGDNPYRSTGAPYLLLGLLGEWRVSSWARVFVNGENLTGVRQSRFHPMLLPQPGPGGRRTVDSWTEDTGATINAGLRLETRR
jgi:outer membrane receptor for ferrienterochelin and colicins